MKFFEPAVRVKYNPLGEYSYRIEYRNHGLDSWYRAYHLDAYLEDMKEGYSALEEAIPAAEKFYDFLMERHNKAIAEAKERKERIKKLGKARIVWKKP